MGFLDKVESMFIAVDFDGTIVMHEYPGLGAPVPGALETILRWIDEGKKIILSTMRSGPQLQEAVDYLTQNGVTLFGVNTNPTQHSWTDSPKVYAHVLVDDTAYGCPLVDGDTERPYVDWSKINL
jgi:hypothetical protein